MLLPLDQTALTEAVPVKADADGVFRVAGTRVTLDTVVAAFREGATAEEIAQQYPSVSLADVYAVIGYYLRQAEKVDGYLGRRRAQAQEGRRENERRFDPQGIRERLLARRTRG